MGCEVGAKHYRLQIVVKILNGVKAAYGDYVQYFGHFFNVAIRLVGWHFNLIGCWLKR